MSADPRRAELDAAVLAWMREPDWREDDARFGLLALRLFEYQYANCEPYRRFCVAQDVGPRDIERWQDVPAVPAGAFKELRIASFGPARDAKIFCTSGTATSRRGSLHLDTLELYETSLLATLQTLLFADLGSAQRTTLRILAPAPAEAPDSSLSHMFGRLLEARGDAHSGYDVRGGKLDAEGLLYALETDRPVALLGTAFAFVHLLDALDARGGGPLTLPPGSRAMETGGFKGLSRELPREQLHVAMSDALGIDPGRIVNQYGMTELGSQFYDSVLVDPAGARRKLGPPWVRVRRIDPASGEEAEPGEPGMLSIHDLVNTGSTCAIQTADLGRRVAGSPEGFELLGRLPGAEARGCSIAADSMLGEAV
ncbi:MAG: long-chain fatty acid--CoA ligase [Myxococcota bacterium]|nr:long-chain fatty acid--CoA ligase [Myxococcota bacterium]